MPVNEVNPFILGMNDLIIDLNFTALEVIFIYSRTNYDLTNH